MYSFPSFLELSILARVYLTTCAGRRAEQRDGVSFDYMKATP